MKPIKFSPPDITRKDIKSVVKVLKSGWITTGRETEKFERELTNFIFDRRITPPRKNFNVYA